VDVIVTTPTPTPSSTPTPTPSPSPSPTAGGCDLTYELIESDQGIITEISSDFISDETNGDILIEE
jgi:hypothetical protein